MIACPKCGVEFVDASGQYAALARLVGEGKLAVMIGCTGCRLLFVPAATLASSPTMAAPIAPPAPIARGTNTRYRTIRELGAGGMGVAFVALDQVSNRRVCIKQLRPGVDARSLIQEWKALSTLDHPSIVRLLDFYEHDGTAHLVMDYVDGFALDRVLSRGVLPELVALDVVGQLADALAAIHARDVIHRDIKPSNVLLEWSGTRVVPRIVDFGIAIVGFLDAYGAATGEGAIAGTPYYMAPEQIRAQQVTAAADVYALGLTLVELICGRHVLGAGSLNELVERRMTTDGFVMPPLACLPATANLVHAMTRSDPAMRMSAHRVADTIRGLLPAIRPPELLAAQNLEGTRLDERERPLGWCDGAGFVGGVSQDYAITVNSGELVLRAPPAAHEKFGTVMQRVWAGHLVGKRVRFAANLAAESCTSASLWLRVDGIDNRQLVFDNMADRALRGTTTGYTPCAIEVTIPEGAAWLCYGVLLVGDGCVRARELWLRSPTTTLVCELRDGPSSRDTLT